MVIDINVFLELVKLALYLKQTLPVKMEVAGLSMVVVVDMEALVHLQVVVQAIIKLVEMMVIAVMEIVIKH
ncbi:MAG TPA: hypothetical protein DIV86_06100 [Alphaproteobacteria bacterium]|nr:hypothetical protein [Alphaproteobacteria bacterium]